MKSFKTADGTNDFSWRQVRSGVSVEVDLDVVSGLESTASVVRSIARTERGEDQLDVELGVSNVEKCLSNLDFSLFWQNELASAIQSYSRVISVSPITLYLNRDSRALRYECSVETVDGPVTEIDAIGDSVSVVGYDDEINNPKDSQVPIHHVVTFVGADSRIVKTERVLDEYDANPPDTEVPDGYRVVWDGKIVGIVGDEVVNETYEIIPSTASSLYYKTNDAETIDVSLFVRLKEGQSWGRVYWGDGTYDEVSEAMLDENGVAELAHSYERVETVVTRNVFVDSHIAWFSAGEGKVYLTHFERWADSIESAKGTFKGCTNLQSSTIPEWSSAVTDVSGCFCGCERLRGKIPAWGPLTTSTEECFYGCSSIEGVISSDSTVLMPERVTSFEDTVKDASDIVRSVFNASWGGFSKFLVDETDPSSYLILSFNILRNRIVENPQARSAEMAEALTTEATLSDLTSSVVRLLDIGTQAGYDFSEIARPTENDSVGTVKSVLNEMMETVWV